MKFVDLSAQQGRIRSDIDRRINAVLEHGQYIMGPEIAELEKALADYLGVKHAISCSSGTDALMMALMALGIGPGDAVITTPFTFIATAEAVSLVGATPVFADIDPRTFNIDPAKIKGGIEYAKKSGLIPKGIITVDLFGLPAEYESIEAIAKEESLFLIEDACQGFGGEYRGKKLCGFGDFAATSFFPAKPLGCYGDGGALFTNDDKLAHIAKSLRIHGTGDSQYDNVRVGINGRMDSIQAAILLSKLDIFKDEVEARHRVAAKYTEGLKGVVETPFLPDGMRSGWAQYSVLSDKRDKIRGQLQKEGIPTAVYYPKPLHLQGAYATLGLSKGDFPVSENAASRIFSLPMHPYLGDKEIESVVKAIHRAVKSEG
ncbi:MAG: DegT/DnrJ/EryC1/StrS family aminotransferase [Nitrospinota bacterium]|nr:DegT/DnrJ/EryC1/StrS family aminotransferase [Nitrospinota bacterium]